MHHTPQKSSQVTLIPLALASFLILMVAFSPAFSATGNDKDPAKTTGEEKPGQQAKESEATRTEQNIEITVTAPRVEILLKKNPAATTVVETPILRTLARTICIEEAMKLVPGVKVDNQADGERVHLSIRGEGILTERGTRGIATLVDGIPLNDPSGYISDFYDIDWATVRRIEVLRGPAAAFYGSSSSGGILNILTRDGGPEPVSGDAELIRSAYGLKKGLGEIGGTTGIMNYSITGSMLSGDGYRQQSAYKADNARGKFTFTLNPRVKITAIVGWTNFFNQNPEGLNLAWFDADPKTLRRLANPDSYTYNEYMKTQRATGGVAATVDLGSGFDLNMAAYYRHTRYSESVPSAVDHRDYDLPGFRFQVNNKAGEGWLKNHLSAGADMAWQSFDEIKHPNLGGAVEGPELLADQNVLQTGAGVFVLDRVELGPAWGVSGSVRYDRVTDKLTDNLQADGIDLSSRVAYHRATGGLGVTWNPRSDFGLYASWGTGFLPPGTEELVNNPYAQGGFNTHLVSATSMGEEVGARGSIARTFTYDLALFHLATKNDFGRYRMADRPLETFYGNVGPTKRYGVEASLAWFPVEPLALRLAYTYSHYKYGTVETLNGETFDGTWLPNIPQHQLYLDGEYHITPGLTVGAALEYVSAWYIDSTNRILPNGYGRTDPYALVHVRVGYKFTFGGMPMELLLSGHNIFNVLYYGFTEPDPDGNSYQPAATAEWSLGLRLGFK
jgi:iron complex outermembrane receptor protein